MFELELNILQQAQTLANKYQRFREELWVMSREGLARFKSANAKLLTLQRRKAVFDKMAAELDDNQAMQPQESWKELNKISPDKVWVQVQDSLQNLLHTMYIRKDIMLVSQNSGHNGVCQM